ncbi:MAG: hypothetical protein M1813_000093 [Trichoglossum hirsutum]|nr:MAG: hypothetical protein M1813_000093 [Trichoglossum hirsutum]
MVHVSQIPKAQACYSFHNGEWISSHDLPSSAALPSSRKPAALKLITWNIDMTTPGMAIRMEAALRYLQQLVSTISSSLPVVIFLQEMTAERLKQICETSWVQEKFIVTDIHNENWPDRSYGITTLVDRNLIVRSVFRVKFQSRFGRDGLFVDIAVSVPNGSSVKDAEIRLCNTHLESLPVWPTTMRSNQVVDCSAQLHTPSIHGGVVAGDFNAIQRFDRTLHIENDLTDAYLALGGQENSKDGYTWGYQSSKYAMRKYGPNRMDKVMFCGGVKVEGLERVGMGTEIEESRKEEVREESRKRGSDPLMWITDHYGLVGTVKVIIGEEQKAKEQEE